MAWRIYKEGQGKMLRGSMAGLIFLAAVVGVMNLHEFLKRFTESTRFKIPGIGWQLDWRYFLDAPVLVLILGWAVYLYNKPKVVDFLIETENELKNRVTWPSRKEGVNASIVVVITVLIMMFFMFGVDSLFTVIKDWFYEKVLG